MTNHYRSLDAAIPIAFALSSCKRQKHFACSRGATQPWRSNYNAICTDWVAKHKRTTRKNVGKESHELSVPLRSAETELPSTKELRARTSPKRCLSSHSTAILRDRVANHKTTACKNVDKTMPELAVPLRGRSDHDPLPKRACSAPVRRTSFPTHHPRHGFSCKIHDFVHPLSRKNAFRARLPSNSNGWSMKTKLSCEASFKFQVHKVWKRSFRARLPSHCKCSKMFNIWKRSFRARLPLHSKCSRYENDAFVRDFLQFLIFEDVKTKLSCETSFNFWKLKMWKRCLNWQFHCGADPTMIRSLSERVLHPSAGQASPHIIRDTVFPAKYTISCIRYLAKTHFVRDFLQIPSAQGMKTKLSCETSFTFQVFKVWKRSFRARLPSNSNFETFRLSDIQTFRHPDLQDIQTFRHPDFQISRLADIQTFRHPDFQDIQTVRHSNSQTIIPPHSKKSVTRKFYFQASFENI